MSIEQAGSGAETNDEEYSERDLNKFAEALRKASPERLKQLLDNVPEENLADLRDALKELEDK